MIKRIVYIATFPVVFAATLWGMERWMIRAMNRLGWRTK